MRTLIEHAQAIAILVDAASSARGVERASLVDGPLPTGRTLADDLVAPIDLPPFPASQMDGYAVRSSELVPGAPALVVAARVPAGTVPAPLEPGTAAPIMTGAPVPEGADAVVPIEQAVPAHFLPEDVAGTVELPTGAAPGLFVRPPGSDVAAGSLLFAAGTLLGPAHLGALAASGLTEIDVRSPLRIWLLSTGEELAPAGPLPPGKIHDANGTSMRAALEGAGADVTALRVSDDVDALWRALAEARRISGALPDLLVTTGGISEGAYEVVREAFEPRGLTIGTVAMQPGGPQGWGLLDLDGTAVPTVCFPGNPVSALVSFEAFLRLPLLAAAGRPSPRRDSVAVLAESADSPKGKHQFRRARLDDEGRVHFVGGASSHLLHNYAMSTVLAHVPLGVDRVEAGDEVVVWALDD
ncbi:molybdopterin molybdotransferase MoeA [Frondihabitans cladoniiphilus]|uniref:Molybdopterin molybdenumtransferase n=1 Tax=Frondihabitans cladoniiphilus TaxID=715785 RepID=A0ABP8VTS2_9MICO